MTRIERVTSPLPRECSTTELHGRITGLPSEIAGAGEGNRTLVISLEGFCSTIELHPPGSSRRFRGLLVALFARTPFARRGAQTGGGGWIRTNVGARPTDLQSAPFSRSGTPPAEPAIILSFPSLGQSTREFPRYRSGGSKRAPAARRERCSRRARRSWDFPVPARFPAPASCGRSCRSRGWCGC
jgi:hypothetical protein